MGLGFYKVMILLPFIYWCIDEKKGLRIDVAVLLSAWINIALKFLFDQPRPFDLDPSLGMISERMGGLPSGHAQNTLVLFMIAASWIKGIIPQGRALHPPHQTCGSMRLPQQSAYQRYDGVLNRTFGTHSFPLSLDHARASGEPQVRVAISPISLRSSIKENKSKIAFSCAAALCLLIGFSRIYLGVHFPTDVLAGWILGGAILCGYFLLGDKIEALLVKGGFRAGMITSAVVSFLLIIYVPNEEILMAGGTMLGMGTGYCLNRRYVGFKSSLVFKRTGFVKYLTLSARLLLGITGFMLIFIALGKLLPQNTDNSNLFGFIRFALAGFWVSVAAPWIFVKLRLAGTEKKNDE